MHAPRHDKTRLDPFLQPRPALSPGHIKFLVVACVRIAEVVVPRVAAETEPPEAAGDSANANRMQSAAPAVQAGDTPYNADTPQPHYGILS